MTTKARQAGKEKRFGQAAWEAFGGPLVMMVSDTAKLLETDRSCPKSNFHAFRLPKGIPEFLNAQVCIPSLSVTRNS